VAGSYCKKAIRSAICQEQTSSRSWTLWALLGPLGNSGPLSELCWAGFPGGPKEGFLGGVRCIYIRVFGGSLKVRRHRRKLQASYIARALSVQCKGFRGGPMHKRIFGGRANVYKGFRFQCFWRPPLQVHVCGQAWAEKSQDGKTKKKLQAPTTLHRNRITHHRPPILTP
jgi:hypothetical protein